MSLAKELHDNVIQKINTKIDTDPLQLFQELIDPQICRAGHFYNRNEFMKWYYSVEKRDGKTNFGFTRVDPLAGTNPIIVFDYQHFSICASFSSSELFVWALYDNVDDLNSIDLNETIDNIKLFAPMIKTTRFVCGSVKN